MNNESRGKISEQLGGGGGGGGGGDGEDNNSSDASHDSSKSTTPERTTPGISDGLHKLPGNGGGSTNRVRQLPTWMAKSSPDMELQYWKGFKERCDRILKIMQKSDGYLVRDVFRFENTEEYEDLLRCLQGDEHYRRGLLQVCREESHVHIVHECAFSNGSCRCSWFQKAKTYRLHYRRDRRASRRDPCRNRTATDIQNLLLYYCTKGRQIVYQKIGGQLVRLPREGYNIQTSRLDGLPEIFREMEIQVPGTGAELQQWEPDGFEDEPDQGNVVAEPRRKKRKVGAQERIQLRVINLLESYPIVPSEAIVKHKVWRNDPDLRFKNLQDREIKAAVSYFKDQTTGYTIHDFQSIYNKETCNPIFSAGVTKFEDYYYNVENSIRILDELVQFQCDEDDDAVLDFVTTLYNVVERKIPKLNCIVVHSPPSAGKNFFFDAIKDFYLNAGHLCNANKYNNFPFQDAEGRRIVLWNEPNYSPEFLEPIKEILGGDSTNVNVKYQHDTPVYRTPVIVLTNNLVSFMNHPAFQDRIRVFDWSSAPYLKDYDKKPNPLAVPAFFAKYGLGK